MPWVREVAVVDPIHYLAESEGDEEAISLGGIPWGYSLADESDLGHRDPSVVETDYEVELWYHHALEAGTERPTFTCGYCADVYKGRSLDSALRWWHSHDCLTLESLERLALLHDALPAGHPFAPVVDGKHAA